MADTRTPAQSAAIRDFTENDLLPLLDAVHHAEARLPQWVDRAAAGEATTLAERTRLLLEDGEIAQAITFLEDAIALETAEPLEERPFAAAGARIAAAWENWRARHGLPEGAEPRTYPFGGAGPDEDTGPAVSPAIGLSDDDFRDPETSPGSREPWTDTQAPPEAGAPAPDVADPALEDAPPALDLPCDQDAAELTAQREAEEQEVRLLLTGKSPEDKPDPAPDQAEEEPEGEPKPRQITEPVADMPPQPARSEQPTPEQEKQDPESPAPQETHLNANRVTIRSPGFLTTLAQGFNQRRDQRLKSRNEQLKAQRQDSARAKLSGFAAAAHDLKRQSEALLHHPVMDAVRQAVPKGLASADEGQKALVGTIVRSNLEFQREVVALQNQHAEVTRRFDALAPDLDDIPARERRAYGEIANKHLKKAEEHLQEIPDHKGNSLWERLKESLRAIGQRLGIVGPDAEAPNQKVTPVAIQTAAQTARPGRH